MYKPSYDEAKNIILQFNKPEKRSDTSYLFYISSTYRSNQNINIIYFMVYYDIGTLHYWIYTVLAREFIEKNELWKSDEILGLGIRKRVVGFEKLKKISEKLKIILKLKQKGDESSVKIRLTSLRDILPQKFSVFDKNFESKTKITEDVVFSNKSDYLLIKTTKENGYNGFRNTRIIKTFQKENFEKELQDSSEKFTEEVKSQEEFEKKSKENEFQESLEQDETSKLIKNEAKSSNSDEPDKENVENFSGDGVSLSLVSQSEMKSTDLIKERTLDYENLERCDKIEKKEELLRLEEEFEHTPKESLEDPLPSLKTEETHRKEEEKDSSELTEAQRISQAPYINSETTFESLGSDLEKANFIDDLKPQSTFHIDGKLYRITQIWENGFEATSHSVKYDFIEMSKQKESDEMFKKSYISDFRMAGTTVVVEDETYVQYIAPNLEQHLKISDKSMVSYFLLQIFHTINILMEEETNFLLDISKLHVVELENELFVKFSPLSVQIEEKQSFNVKNLSPWLNKLEIICTDVNEMIQILKNNLRLYDLNQIVKNHISQIDFN